MKKEFNLKNIVRPHLKGLKPYSSARDEFKGEAEVMLDANESPFNNLINRYPDPLQVELKNKLSPIKGIDPSYIFLGNGSDEPIDLLIRAFCKPGKDAVLITPPTYGMYQVAAAINNVPLIECKLTHTFEVDKKTLEKQLPNARITFLCSPNNPSGNLLDLDQLERWCTLSEGLVVVDEAYIDFCPEASVVQEVKTIPNLVVLQTFSKAMGAAGIRLGMAFAHPDILQVLNNIKPPYNINALTIKKGLEILDSIETVQKQAQLLVREREQLVVEMKNMSFVASVFDSQANFLLVKVNDPIFVKSHLANRGIIVRDRSNLIHCEGCLRISIGTPEENNLLLEALNALK